MMRTKRSSHNHKPKARVTSPGPNVVCLNLNALLRSKAPPAVTVDLLPKPKSVSSGDDIRLPDPQSAILITEGAVDILLSVESDLVPVKQLEPGWVFGNLPLLGVETFRCRAVAATDCQIVILDQDRLRTIMREAPRVTARLMEMFTSRLLELDLDRVLKHFGIIEAQLIHLLLYLADRNGLIEGVSQRDLACMLSTSRRIIGRALGGLRQRGFVEISPMRIKLLVDLGGTC